MSQVKKIFAPAAVLSSALLWRKKLRENSSAKSSEKISKIKFILTDTGTREIVRHRKIVPLYGTPRRSAHYAKKHEGDFKRDFILKYKWKGLKG